MSSSGLLGYQARTCADTCRQNTMQTHNENKTQLGTVPLASIWMCILSHKNTEEKMVEVGETRQVSEWRIEGGSKEIGKGIRDKGKKA